MAQPPRGPPPPPPPGPPPPQALMHLQSIQAQVHPQAHFPPHQQQPTSGHQPPGVGGKQYFTPLDVPPLVCPEPEDPKNNRNHDANTPKMKQVKTKIDKFVEYAIKNGPQFEEITRGRQMGQPGWEFLNNEEHSGYYRFRLYQSWKAQQKPNVGEIWNVLESLNGGKESIRSAREFFLSKPKEDTDRMTEMLIDRVQSLPVQDFPKRLHLVYLVNDILFHLEHSDGRAYILRAFEETLGRLLSSIYHSGLQDETNAEANKSKMHKIVQFWGQKGVFPLSAISGFVQDMMNAKMSEPTKCSPLLLPQELIQYKAQQMAQARAQEMALPQQSNFAGNPSYPFKGEMHSAPFASHGAQQPQGQAHLQHPQNSKLNPAAQGQSFQIQPPLASGQSTLQSSTNPSTLPATANTGVTDIAGVAAQAVQNLQGMLSSNSKFHGLGLQGQASTPSFIKEFDQGCTEFDFPPGLIPYLVKKMNEIDPTPYSPIDSAKVKIAIPISELEPGYIAMRIDKFFSEIGTESETKLEGRSEGGERKHEDYEMSSIEPKGGLGLGFKDAEMETDANSNMKADGSLGIQGGGPFLGLGASAEPHAPNPNDDDYTAYRKERARIYHSMMAEREKFRQSAKPLSK